MAMHMAFLYADHIAASRRQSIAEDVRPGIPEGPRKLLRQFS